MSTHKYAAAPERDYMGSLLDPSSDVLDSERTVNPDHLHGDSDKLRNNVTVVIRIFHEDRDVRAHRDGRGIEIVLAPELDAELKAEPFDVASAEDGVQVEKSVVVNLKTVVCVAKCPHEAELTTEATR